MSAQAQIRPHIAAVTGRQPSHRGIYIILAAGLLVAAAGWAWSLHERTLAIETIAPAYQDIETSTSSTGIVVPAHDFQVRANFSGIVDQVYVRVGQKVHAGQMLIRMKDQYALPRLDTARAGLEASEASLENAQQNGTRDERIGYMQDLVRANSERDNAASALVTLQELEQRGSVSEAEVLNGEQRLKLANAAVHALNERMTQRYSAKDIESLKEKVRADRDTLDAERVSWANANVSTPISGTVYIIPVARYDFVPAGAELMRVADLGHLEVRASVFEPDIGKLRAGQPVTIRWEGAPGKSWTGKVVSAPIAVDRTGPLSFGLCTIALTSPIDNLPVNSGVSVLVQSQKHSHVLAIPRQSLLGAGGNAFVFRIVDGRLRKTPVKTGLFNAMSVEIASGLNDHDLIVLHAVGASTPLRDGRRVKSTQDR